MSEKKYAAPCEECGGKCCKYIAIEIDTPGTKKDYDYIRWYLLHKDVNVFIDHSKKWFIEFRTPCEVQDDNNNCTIYNDRPKICREHGKEDGDCEFYDSPYFKYFSNCIEYEKYLNKKGIDWKFKKLK
jgi:uncharacterized protein